MINVDVGLGSIERIGQYTNDIQHEKDYIKKGELAKIKDKNYQFVEKGNIQFKNVSMRYNEESDCILKNVSFSV